MKIPRSFSVKVQYVLDQWIPPRLRDSKWFMYLPMRLIFKDVVDDFINFKEVVFSLSPTEFGKLYERTGHVQELQGETDLNQACLDMIIDTIKTKRVLEVGSGRGYLANILSENHNVTACDIVISPKVADRYPKIKFVQGNIEKLPFNDNSFDTVVSTHTLEHVQHLPKAIAELRRVAKKQLIIVVPKQRPYKYTFSLHTQFFPYKWSIENSFGFRKDALIQDFGDWFYVENNPKP